jgi:predicted AAA+ superfamily ATPase
MTSFPVVILTGARQTGKTTLVEHLPSSKDRKFRSLDDPVSLELAVKDPKLLLAEAEKITLDEVQRHPDLLLAIKMDVDKNRVRGRFLLTGSANLLMMKAVSDSLTGWAVYLHLRPLTEKEKRGNPDPGIWGKLLKARSAEEAEKLISPPTAEQAKWRWTEAVLQGGFPIATLESDPRRRRQWFEGYVATYLDRDLRQLSQIDNTIDFMRLMKIAALRNGKLANQAEMARDAALSHATAHRYLNILETSFLITRVNTYGASRTKRIVKTPKLYWVDTGLAASLSGVQSEEDLKSHESVGGLLENLVWHHLRCWADTFVDHVEILYWRTAGGEEVDFVLEGKDFRLLPIEIKSGMSVSSSDMRHLNSFLTEYSKRAALA